MTYKALVKRAESYLYDAQSDLQVLTKRHDKETPVFVTSLRGVEFALNNIEQVLANESSHEKVAEVYSAVVYIGITIDVIIRAERPGDRLPIIKALRRAKENLKDTLERLGW
jgi:hypothetical protein